MKTRRYLRAILAFVCAASPVLEAAATPQVPILQTPAPSAFAEYAVLPPLIAAFHAPRLGFDRFLHEARDFYRDFRMSQLASPGHAHPYLFAMASVTASRYGGDGINTPTFQDTRTLPAGRPWKHVRHALHPKWGVMDIVSEYDHLVGLQMPGGSETMRVEKSSVRPLLSATRLADALGVSHHTVIEPAIRAGWVESDIPLDETQGKAYFDWDRLKEFRDHFVLREPREAYYSLGEFADLIGRDPNRVRAMVRSGALRPDQVIWEGDSRGSPYFLRRDEERWLTRWAPQNRSDTYTVQELARRLGVPERRALWLLGSGEIAVEPVGIPSLQAYRMSPAELEKVRTRLAATPAPAQEALIGLRDEFFSLQELAVALGVSASYLTKRVSAHDLQPSQTVRLSAGHHTHYFRKRDLDLFRKIFAPESVRHARTLASLAAELKISVSLLTVYLKDGVFQPADVLGSSAKPFYVVSPRAIQAFEAFLHPPETRVSLFVLSKRYERNIMVIAQLAEELYLPLEVEQNSQRTERFLRLTDESRLASRIQKRPPEGMISRQTVAERLGVHLRHLRETRSDYALNYGDYVQHFYWANTLPEAPVTPEKAAAWIQQRTSDPVDSADEDHAPSVNGRARISRWLSRGFTVHHVSRVSRQSSLAVPHPGRARDILLKADHPLEGDSLLLLLAGLPVSLDPIWRQLGVGVQRNLSAQAIYFAVPDRLERLAVGFSRFAPSLRLRWVDHAVTADERFAALRDGTWPVSTRPQDWADTVLAIAFGALWPTEMLETVAAMQTQDSERVGLYVNGMGRLLSAVGTRYFHLRRQSTGVLLRDWLAPFQGTVGMDTERLEEWSEAWVQSLDTARRANWRGRRNAELHTAA